MKRSGFAAMALWVGGGLALAGAAEAQRPAVEVGIVAQVPVAVVRAEAAGAPPGDLAELVRELRRARVPAGEAVEILRFAPLATDIRFPTRDGSPAADGVRLSDRVRSLHDRGVRGRELAREIHRELRAQGIPAGGEGARRGPPPIARDYIPADARRGMGERRDRDVRMERRGPSADPRGDAARDRPSPDPRSEVDRGRRGPPDDAGQRQQRTPPDAGQRQGGPPAEAGQRRGGPPADANRRGGGPPSDRRSS